MSTSGSFSKVDHCLNIVAVPGCCVVSRQIALRESAGREDTQYAESPRCAHIDEFSSIKRAELRPFETN